MWQKSLMAAALAGSVMLAGCGGGGSSGSSGGSGGGGGGGTTERNDFAGPLDVIQEPVSDQVLKQLADATAGTPLSGVITCVDEVVVGDTLDIVDVLATLADAGTPNFNASATLVQAELTNLVADLQGLLLSLAGGSGCGATIPAPGGFSNPLVGTPLEPFAATLISTLESVQAQLTGAAAGGGTPDLGILSGLVGQLADGYASALAMVPAEATDAPVVGPALGLVGTALSDLETTVAAAESADAEATAAAITATVEHLINGLLTEVLPVGMLEQGSGTGGALTGQFTDALETLTGLLSGGFATPGGDLGGNALLDVVESLLSPLTGAIPGGGAGDPASVLTGLLDQITAALGGGAAGLPIPAVGGDALNTALAQLTGLLDTAGIGDGPLAPLVDILDDILGGLLGGLI